MWVTATHCRKTYQIVDLPDYWITESTIKNRFESNLFIISYEFLRNKNIEGILVLFLVSKPEIPVPFRFLYPFNTLL